MLSTRCANDRISHSAIMDKIIAPNKLKLGIFRSLKAGVNPEFPEQGTPQGGVCSPLLANIALDGIEEVQPKGIGRTYPKLHYWKKNGEPYYNQKRAVTGVRYADDMVFVLQDTKDEKHNEIQVQGLLTSLKEFLHERGMELSSEKTKLTEPTKGFDFLGWNFKIRRNGKFKSRPSKENFQKFKEKVKAIVNSSNMGATEKATKLAPIVRGWRKYHKYCDMSNARDKLWHISHRAFQVFNKETKQNRHTSKELVEKAFPKVPYSINSHVTVFRDKSPFDGDFIYWSKRKSKLYDGDVSRTLKKQNHKCASCGLKFLPEDEIHLHHKDGNHNNWKWNNLEVLHASCHHYTHSAKQNT